MPTPERAKAATTTSSPLSAPRSGCRGDVSSSKSKGPIFKRFVSSAPPCRQPPVLDLRKRDPTILQRHDGRLSGVCARDGLQKQGKLNTCSLSLKIMLTKTFPMLGTSLPMRAQTAKLATLLSVSTASAATPICVSARQRSGGDRTSTFKSVSLSYRMDESCRIPKLGRVVWSPLTAL